MKKTKLIVTSILALCPLLIIATPVTGKEGMPLSKEETFYRGNKFPSFEILKANFRAIWPNTELIQVLGKKHLPLLDAYQIHYIGKRIRVYFGNDFIVYKLDNTLWIMKESGGPGGEGEWRYISVKKTP